MLPYKLYYNKEDLCHGLAPSSSTFNFLVPLTPFEGLFRTFMDDGWVGGLHGWRGTKLGRGDRKSSLDHGEDIIISTGTHRLILKYSCY